MPISSMDFIALIWFLLCWQGYGYYARQRAKHCPCLSNTLDIYREDWMRRMLLRDNRIADASVVGNLERNGAFFASSCLLIIAGILTALGYTDQAMRVFSEMPFSQVPTRLLWELKLVVLLLIFVYAFFKFTWAMRQYNFVAVLIGAAPIHGDTSVSPAAREAFAVNAAHVCNMAGDAFNFGLRAFYYALAALTWILHPACLILVSALVVLVLYRREFNSSALRALRKGKIFEEKPV